MDKKRPLIQDKHLADALQRILRPLVRFLLSRGFTYTRFIQILRPLYVDLAVESCNTLEETPTDSRISLLTGIARRYVKELRQEGEDSRVAQLKITPAAKLIAQWVTNRRFVDQEGQPKTLPRLAKNEREPSFEELAIACSTDIRPRTLLDNLVERNLVELTKDDRVKLNSEAYTPDNTQEELIDYFGIHLHDHMAAATHNLSDTPVKFFERSAFQGGLTDNDIAALNQLTEQQAGELLKKIYAEAARLNAANADDNDPGQRFRLGIYAYAEAEQSDTD